MHNILKHDLRLLGKMVSFRYIFSKQQQEQLLSNTMQKKYDRICDLNPGPLPFWSGALKPQS